MYCEKGGEMYAIVIFSSARCGNCPRNVCYWFGSRGRIVRASSSHISGIMLESYDSSGERYKKEVRVWLMAQVYLLA